jgi:hypothetical protein
MRIHGTSPQTRMLPGHHLIDSRAGVLTIILRMMSPVTPRLPVFPMDTAFKGPFLAQIAFGYDGRNRRKLLMVQLVPEILGEGLVLLTRRVK